MRCWGSGALLGNGTPATIGDDETPGSAGPVDLGPGRTATRIAVGLNHTCAVLDDGTLRCWGLLGGLGLPNLPVAFGEYLGDNESPTSVDPVDLGADRTAVEVTVGNGNTCASLDDGTLRCWGANEWGQLGYANTVRIGDDETPGSQPPVDVGEGRTTAQLSAGNAFTCAILDDGNVRCWGFAGDGGLGPGVVGNIGDDETPGSVDVLDFGSRGVLPGLSTTVYADEATVAVGESLHVHVRVVNSGDTALQDVTISSPDIPDCEVAPFDMAVGATVTVDCTRVMSADDAPVFSTTASVVANQVPTAVVSNQLDVAVEAAAPGLSVVLSAPQVSTDPGGPPDRLVRGRGQHRQRRSVRCHHRGPDGARLRGGPVRPGGRRGPHRELHRGDHAG